MSLQNSKLLALFRGSKNEIEFLSSVISEVGPLSDEAEGRSKIHGIYMFIKKKWQASNRTVENFSNRNSDWLNKFSVFNNIKDGSTTESTNPSRGRPKKSIQECSKFTRKRKLQDVTEALCTSHLSEALSIKYIKDQEKARSDIVTAVAIASPERLNRIKGSIPTPPTTIPKNYTTEEALALFMDMSLSKEKYNILRSSLKYHNINVLPSYHQITSAKKEAVPPNLRVTDTSVEVQLQDLMDHTARRLVQSLPEPVIKSLPERLTLVSKWGCDGSSGQSVYKQKIGTTTDPGISDGNMFMASIVPLRLKSETLEHWKNPRPSSVHFCRPILFQYTKESSAIIKDTVGSIKSQIGQLKPSVIDIKNGKTIVVNYELFLTMIDGKVLNEITNTTSTMKCPICKRSQKDFKNPEPSAGDEHNYEYGISPLHGRIRCMEFILKLAYTIPRDNEVFDENTSEKEKQKLRQKIIQKEFFEELGLKIDCPKYGYGNTNDGNTARRFFDNSDCTAKITRVDKNIIRRFGVILNVLNSKEVINGVKFEQYSAETAQLLEKLYPEKKLTPTVHKILSHGKELIEYQCLPIGELSEEAQECKNKEYKKFRYTNTCKSSRLRQNEDLYNMLSASSDPLISSLRHVRSQKDLKQHFSCPEILSLLDISTNTNDYFKNNDDE